MPLKIIGLWITRDLFSIKSRFGWCYNSSIIGKWNAFFHFGGSRQVLTFDKKDVRRRNHGTTTSQQRGTKFTRESQNRDAQES